MSLKTIFLFVVFFINQVVFATGNVMSPKSTRSMEVNLLVSESQISLDKTVDLTIRIKQKGQGTLNQGMLYIKGIEPFDVVGERNMNNMNVVNGEVASLIEKVLTIKPKSVGAFEVGPITIENNGDAIVSNTVQVRVGMENFVKNEKVSGSDLLGNSDTNQNLWNSAGKISYFDDIFSPEIIVLIVIMLTALYLHNSKKSQTTIKKEQIYHLDIPKYTDSQFLDKCLIFLEDYILKNNKLEIISISNFDLRKLEKDSERRKEVGLIIDDIYFQKKQKECKKEKRIEIQEKISNFVQQNT